MKTKQPVLLKPNHPELLGKLSGRKINRKVRLQSLKNRQKTNVSKEWYQQLDKFLLIITIIFGFGGFGFGIALRCNSEKLSPLYVESNNAQQSFPLENN